MQQLLDKDELKNKSLLSMFKIDTSANVQYTYKDVIKCMAALFFKQKYNNVVKSAFEIWLNAAIASQQQQEDGVDESAHSAHSAQSAHSEPYREMIEGDIVELRKPEYAVDKKNI